MPRRPTPSYRLYDEFMVEKAIKHLHRYGYTFVRRCDFLGFRYRAVLNRHTWNTEYHHYVPGARRIINSFKKLGEFMACRHRRVEATQPVRLRRRRYVHQQEESAESAAPVTPQPQELDIQRELEALEHDYFVKVAEMRERQARLDEIGAFIVSMRRGSVRALPLPEI